MWQFLKHVGFTAASSVVGAIAFAFSGFALLHLPHMNAIAVIAHVPWLLLAIDLAGPIRLILVERVWSASHCFSHHRRCWGIRNTYGCRR